MKKINLAVLGLSNNEGSREITLTAAIRKDDLGRFANIPFLTESYEIWDDETYFVVISEDEGGGVAGAAEHGCPATVVVRAVIPDYSNYTQSFYRATGLQLDSRFL